GGRPGEAGRGAGALGLLSRRLSVAGRFLKSRLAARQSGDLYLNVGHSGLDRPGFLAALAASGLPIAVMIHDLIPITHPEFCAPAAGGRHLRRLEATLTHARLIITNSRATADEVAAFARGHDLPLPTLCPAPLGVEAAFLSPSSSPFSSPFSSPPGGSPAEGREGGGGSPAEGREGGRGEDPPTGVTGFTVNAAAAEPYFVVVGTIEARKNLAFLLTLWRRLDEAMGEAAPRLFLVGRRGWENEAVLDHLERSQSARRLAIEAPGLSDAELARLMAGARALLAPSLAEGFDLPVAEARALGVPVIGSDIPVHRELAPGAKLIDPLDGPGWLAAIEAASFTPLSQRCHPAASTWADHFSKVRGALGLPSGPAAPQPVGG
ncbi:MAG TPA: glycosyltransferase family 1 protein, partial [Caulobacteraceae bacterium]|nr:glycosyltransferase family 1 protein [Caulobacteraceae bacterium]